MDHAERDNVQGPEEEKIKAPVKRDAKGRFVKGRSANPLGRPKGSRNKVTLLRIMAEEAVRDRNLDRMLEVADMIVSDALDGDFRAQKLIWESIMSKSSADDKTHASEKLEINISTSSPDGPKVVGEIIDQEED